jgi:hypothetical protein
MDERLASMIEYYKTDDIMEIARKIKEEEGGRVEVYQYVSTDPWHEGEKMIYTVRDRYERENLFSSSYCKKIKKLL